MVGVKLKSVLLQPILMTPRFHWLFVGPIRKMEYIPIVKSKTLVMGFR